MLFRKTLTALGVALALVVLATGTMAAQFSGPALTVPQTANELQTPTVDPQILDPGLRDVLIAPGDVIDVRIFNFSSTIFSPPVRVSSDGFVQLPLIGPVPVGGLTVAAAENLIAQRLMSAGMYQNPQVTIAVTEATSQFATVSGEMHGVVPIAGSRRLLEVLAAAGSLPPTASHVITILRPGQEKPIVVDLGTDPARSAQANIPILPRDTILIARVGVVYMLGAFAKQGEIPLTQNAPLTLMQATSLAGGDGFEGRYEDLRIVRTVGLERKLVRVDIKQVLRGKAPDPVLEANDIVFLPSNALKAALKSGGIVSGIGVVSNIVTLLLYVLRTP